MEGDSGVIDVEIVGADIFVEQSATPDIPAGLVLDKLKLVDGPGSGLNADTLHEKTASDFASSNLDNVQALPSGLYDAIKVDGGYF
jgi:hypothetical protein